MLPNRLTLVDEINRGDHAYLEDGDRCLFFGEYFADKGYEGGYTNDLIINFKIAPSAIARKPGRGHYKRKAIAEIGAALRNVVSQREAELLTWVPIPPSKAIGHVDYDDRLLQTLRVAFRDYDVDLRPLLRQTVSTEADHHAVNRLTPDELLDVLELDGAQTRAPLRERGIVLFDDVLTTGKHYKCCVRRLRDAFPNVVIRGLFVARRILPNPFDGF